MFQNIVIFNGIFVPRKNPKMHCNFP